MTILEIYPFRINEYDFSNFFPILFPIEFHSKPLPNRRNAFELSAFAMLLARIIDSRKIFSNIVDSEIEIYTFEINTVRVRNISFPILLPIEFRTIS